MENNEYFELEEMRQQMNTLKAKLAQEEIVNDRLLRDAMKSKARTINRNAWRSSLSGLFVIILVSTTFPRMGYSWYFIGATVGFMLACIFYTFQYHRNVNSKTLDGDLLTVAKTMRELKANYQRWIRRIIIPTIGWVAWLIYEYSTIYHLDTTATLIGIGAIIIGGAIGGIIGYRMHRQVVDTCDEIIRSIEK